MSWAQVVDVVDMGLLVVDLDQRVTEWNQWMARHSGLSRDEVLGKPLGEIFTDLQDRRFQRKARLVLNLGHYAFFSQKLHGGLLPFRPVSSLDIPFDRMQQSCTMGPLRGDDGRIIGAFLSVTDVTETAAFERRLRELTTRDPLTGVANRRLLYERADLELTRHRRYTRPISLCMIDIDHFKRVNDTYGHACGDLVLQEVARQIGLALRETDLVARFGGEEFACLLPESDLATATAIAERIRVAIAATRVPCMELGGRVTISIGVATFDQGCTALDVLLARADQALYQAKAEGRNRVISSHATSCG
ncbi:MAG: GGDEF domain-containing protein [Deltaproteobacteria bacterium]|nr:GGDEF domain-containing protein [Deltaproteobacteria bacterium]